MACISKRRDRYIIDFYDNQGKRRWQTLPKDATKTDARKILRDIEDKLEKGIFLPPKQYPRFSEFADSWLELKRQNIRYSTFKQYRGHLKNHLKPYFGGTKINRIGYDEVEKFVAHSITDGVQLLTLKRILINLGAIMTYAVRKRYLD